MSFIIDQTRPDQTRPDQTRPDQTVVHARNSSLELLRVLGMLAIVFHHFAVHGGFDFPSDSITLNRLWQQFIIMGGSLGNNVFVLISGYFLICSDGVKLNKLFSLWLKMFFYSVAIYLVFVLAGHDPSSLKALITSMLPVSRSLYWFPATYVILYALHGWLNLFLKNLSRENYRKFLATLILMWCILSTLLKSGFGGSNLTTFILLYSLAAYVRLWAPDFANSKFILYGLGFIAVNYSIAIAFDIIGLRIPFFAAHANYFYGMTRPFTLAATLCLLIGFKSLNIPHSKLINLLASATFGVYLIHDNCMVRPFLWHEVFRNFSFQNSPYLIPYSIVVVLLVYVVCTLIELSRAKLFALCKADTFCANFAHMTELSSKKLQHLLKC